MSELSRFLDSIIGELVLYRRIAGDDLLLYFIGTPERNYEQSKTIWLEPPWRYESDDKFLVGSGDFLLEASDFSSEDEYSLEFNRRANFLNPLTKSVLERYVLASNAHDLTLYFSNNQVVRTFARTSDASVLWSCVDIAQNLILEVASSGISQGVFSSAKSKPKLKLVRESNPK